jgi:hypothetical protein
MALWTCNSGFSWPISGLSLLRIINNYYKTQEALTLELSDSASRLF